MSRKIEDLTPRLQTKFMEFKKKMLEAGLEFIVTQTLRTRAEQVAFYAQGRETLAQVNLKRKMAGLAPISEAENKRKITWTLNSRHLPQKDGKAVAFDIAICKNGAVQWSDKVDVNDNDIPDYREAGRIGQSVGLLWGGVWRTPDLPHFELKE